MSIRKQKDGRWRCDWRDPRRGGRLVTERFDRGEAGRAAALERDHRIKVEKIKTRNLALSGGGPTFRELAQDYINCRGIELSDRTRAEILRTAAKYALPVMGALPITRATIAHWGECEKRMIARGLDTRTINTYFTYLARMFAFAVERDYLKDNPWRNRRSLRCVRRPQIELMTPEELQRILAAADPHLAWAIEIELNVGCRPGASELFALKWDDFDYQTGAVRIYAPKTDHWHTQYVSAEFLERLRERREFLRQDNLRLAKRRRRVVPECPCVISFQGAPVKRLDSAWEAAKKKAGIARRIRFYDLRHFYITHALAAGADLLDLAHRVGHKDATMIVTVYAHLVEKMQSKKPLYTPEKALKAFFVPKMLAKNVGKTEKGPFGPSPNNVITFKKTGRGEWI